jgi:hypothetical protein
LIAKKLSLLVLLLTASLAGAEGPELGLDLSEPTPSVPLAPKKASRAHLEGRVLVVPPLKGNKLDLKLHGQILSALQARLGGRVIGAEKTLIALKLLHLTPDNLSTDFLAPLGKELKASFAVTVELSANNLAAHLFYLGTEVPPADLNFQVSGGFTAKQANQVALALMKKITTAPEAPLVTITPSPDANNATDVETELNRDRELEEERTRKPVEAPPVPRTQARLLAAAGMGTAFRNFNVSGDGATALTPVSFSAMPALGAYVSVSPLKLMERFADARWNDVVIDAQFRRAFIHAKAQGGPDDGARCRITDDEFQVRVGWRYRLGEGYLPSVGVGAGWGSERSWFDACELKVVSTDYRAIDVQLKVRQPLFRDLVSLELNAGPRFLHGGPTADRPGGSFGGEAWVDARLFSFLFVRAGARLSSTRLAQANGLAVSDLRTFYALELGAFY